MTKTVRLECGHCGRNLATVTGPHPLRITPATVQQPAGRASGSAAVMPDGHQRNVFHCLCLARYAIRYERLVTAYDEAIATGRSRPAIAVGIDLK